MKPKMHFSNRDERAWQAHCAEWAPRMARAADTAFAEYICGTRTHESFAEVAEIADSACAKHCTPVKLGHVPAWFKKRCVRVLGPRCFEHLEFTSPWFEHAGSIKLPLDTVIRNPCKRALFAHAKQVYDVFVVEPIRPWVIDSSDRAVTKLTEEMYSEILPVRRGVFLDVLAKLLEQPMKLAEAMRCRLQLERAAVSGWRRMRVIFIPYDVQETESMIPTSFHLRTCKCPACEPKRKRPPGAVCQCSVCKSLLVNTRKTRKSKRNLV